MVQCRVDYSQLSNKRMALWTDNDWMEWQANRLSSAILMPESMVRQLTSKNTEGPSAFRAACWVLDVQRIFNVSIQAAEIRLRELGMLAGISKPDIDYELTFFAK